MAYVELTLINVGYITLALKYGDKPDDLQASIEFFSTKFGLVLVVLGAMHFFNMFNFDKMRRKAKRTFPGANAEKSAPVAPLM